MSKKKAKAKRKPLKTIVNDILNEAIYYRPEKTSKLRLQEPSFVFHDSKTDLDALMDIHGVKPIRDFEELLGDFWPENESVDDFIATIDEWRHEGE